MKPRRTDDDRPAHCRRRSRRSGCEGHGGPVRRLVLAWFARRGSAKTLHLLWTTTFAVLLVLPVPSLLAPSWDLPILPARTTAIERHLPDRTASEPSATAIRRTSGRQPNSVAPVPTGYLPFPPRADGSIPLTPAAAVFLIWALGAGLGLASLGAAALRFRKLARGRPRFVIRTGYGRQICSAAGRTCALTPESCPVPRFPHP